MIKLYKTLRAFRSRNNFRCDLLVVSSCGGHLKQILDLHPSYREKETYFAINDNFSLPQEFNHNSFRIIHAERNILQLVHIFEALLTFMLLKPKVLLSAGAAPIVIFSLIGKFFGIKTIFIESFSRITSPSFTGRIMYYIADSFFYQWPPLVKFFPNGIYKGNIL